VLSCIGIAKADQLRQLLRVQFIDAGAVGMLLCHRALSAAIRGHVRFQRVSERECPTRIHGITPSHKRPKRSPSILPATKTKIRIHDHRSIDADQRWLRVGRLRFQRVRTAHHSQPLVHDLTTDNADGIVLCTGRPVSNGNIVDRAAPGALKFTDGTLPRLIRHRANHAPAVNACKTEYCAVSLRVEGARVWLEVK